MEGSTYSLRMKEDDLLCQFFSAYLKLPVFPVALDYQAAADDEKRGLVLLDPRHSHLDCWDNPDVQRKLLHWMESRRFPFFSQSVLFSEYRFCLKIIEKLESGVERICSYNHFILLKNKMERSQGCVQYQLWLTIDECIQLTNTNDNTTAVKIDLQKLAGVRKRYQEEITNMGLDLSTHFSLEMDEDNCFKWCKEVQDNVIHRLANYWWPRIFNDAECCSISHRPKEDISLLEALQANVSAGDPFQDFLIKSKEENNYYSSLYNLWTEINNLLVHQMKYTGYEIHMGYMKLYTKYYETVPLSNFSSLPETSRCNHELLLKTLNDIQDEILGIIGEKWTLFQNEDYESFYSCFPEEIKIKIDHNFKISSSKEETPPTISRQASSKSRATSSRKAWPKFDMVLSVTDLFNTPFEGIADLDILDEFQHYLQEKCGPVSLQISSYQLWVSILLHRKMPPSARERSARKIYRSFFSKSAKSHLALRDAHSGNNLIRVKGHRNVSHVFEQMQLSTAENFLHQLQEFLKTKHGIDSSTSKSASVHSSTSNVFKMDSLENFFKDVTYSAETIKELQLFITNSSNGQSRKMRAFEKFLVSSSPEQCPGLMINDLRFWKEVERLQVLRNGSASGHLLQKKIEALVDNYLDADTPPWVKISISSNTAKEIVEKLHHEDENKELLIDMLIKAQKNVFVQLLEFWVAFNQTYRSVPSTPSCTSSIISLTSTCTKSSCHPMTPSLSPTVINSTGRRKSVLTFTRQEGLQWMENSPKQTP